MWRPDPSLGFLLLWSLTTDNIQLGVNCHRVTTAWISLVCYLDPEWGRWGSGPEAWHWSGIGVGPKATSQNSFLRLPPDPLLSIFPLVDFLRSIIWVRKRVHEDRTRETPDVSGDEGETGMSHQPGFPGTSHSKTGTTPTHGAGTLTKLGVHWISKSKAISVEKQYLFRREIFHH